MVPFIVTVILVGSALLTCCLAAIGIAQAAMRSAGAHREQGSATTLRLGGERGAPAPSSTDSGTRIAA